MKKWVPPQRNYDNIQYESYRKIVDQKFNDLADELSDCYYNFWKHGQSKPFNGGKQEYDVQPTLEESNALFNKLHGLIWHLHEEALEAEHEKRAEKDRDPKFTRDLAAKMERDPNRKQDRGFRLAQYKQEGIEIAR